MFKPPFSPIQPITDIRTQEAYTELLSVIEHTPERWTNVDAYASDPRYVLHNREIGRIDGKIVLLYQPGLTEPSIFHPGAKLFNGLYDTPYQL